MDATTQMTCRRRADRVAPVGADIPNDFTRPPSTPLPCRVRVVDDPKIIDAQGRIFQYLGPSLHVNLDDRGMVRSLEFVGVQLDKVYISEM